MGLLAIRRLIRHARHLDLCVAEVEARLVVGAQDDAHRHRRNESDLSPVLLPSFVAFSVHELLKNAMGAHVRAAGADKLDQLAPIQVHHGTQGGIAWVGVSDFGNGWVDSPNDARKFLATTNIEREPTYTYSRQFGSTFEGLGMGLPLAALHAQYLGGALHLHSPIGKGAHASFTFDITGNLVEPDFHVHIADLRSGNRE